MSISFNGAWRQVSERVTLMFSPVRNTDELPVVVPVGSFSGSAPVRLTPADFKDIAYTPSFLLPALLDETLLVEREYHMACADGFRSYFEDMYATDGEQEVFLEHVYTRSEVIADVVNETRIDSRAPAPLAIRVGIVHGWLSALALTDFQLAQVGMQLLIYLVTLEQGRRELGNEELPSSVTLAHPWGGRVPVWNPKAC